MARSFRQASFSIRLYSILFSVLTLSACSTSKPQSILLGRSDLLFPDAIEISDELVIKNVLQRLNSRQKVFLFSSKKPEAWSALNKTYLASTLLNTVQGTSALCFVLGHELGHLELHQATQESHDSSKLEFEADEYALNHCLAAGYSGYEAVTLLQDLDRYNDNPDQRALLEKRLEKIREDLHEIPYQPFEMPSLELRMLKKKLLQQN